MIFFEVTGIKGEPYQWGVYYAHPGPKDGPFTGLSINLDSRGSKKFARGLPNIVFWTVFESEFAQIGLMP